jgi:hypothetical protein
MRPHPLKIEIPTGTVNHQKISSLSRAVDDQIIDDSSLLIEHEGVLATGDSKFANAVGKKILQPSQSAGTGNRDLSHVGNIEHAGGRSHGFMLIHDSRILDRHEPTPELDHASSACDMSGFERRMFEKRRITHHALSVDVEGELIEPLGRRALKSRYV